jgi:predicted nucleic acid-binding protein
MKEVLDTRFFMEYFYSSSKEVQERMRKKLSNLIKRKEGIVPAVVLAEVVNLTCRFRGADEAKNRYFSILRSGLIIEPMTADVSMEAGLMKCKYRRVPIGDCVIASTAKLKSAGVLSDDEHFDQIKGIRRKW